jgi:hypothetical protein
MDLGHNSKRQGTDSGLAEVLQGCARALQSGMKPQSDCCVHMQRVQHQSALVIVGADLQGISIYPRLVSSQEKDLNLSG